jgi:hypothetical protein
MGAKLIVGILIVVVVVGGILYFGSDIFRTKVDRAVEGFTEWTPENIAKDPKGYLFFCRKQTEDAIGKLKASQIGISQNRAKIDAMKTEADHKAKVGQEALAELKVLYREAEKAGKWPANWRDQDRNKEWTKRQIVGLHRQVRQQRTLSAKCDAGMKQCDVELAKAKRLMADASARLGEISVAEQSLEVEQLSKGLETQLVNMKAALQHLVGAVGDGQQDLDLDKMAKEAEAAVDEAEFEAIMKAE